MQDKTWHQEMDQNAHEITYTHFLQMTKWGVILTTLILLGLLLFVY